MVDCTLEDGTETHCHRIKVGYLPEGLEIGPFCPATPVAPVMAETPMPLGTVAKVGVALDGAPIFSDAPQIQQTGHMPALDVGFNEPYTQRASFFLAHSHAYSGVSFCHGDHHD